MINEIYKICDESQNIKLDIARLFLQKGQTFLWEERFDAKTAHKLFDAFKNFPEVKCAFAYKIKVDSNGYGSQGDYGDIFFELPENVQKDIIDTIEVANTLVLFRKNAILNQYQNTSSNQDAFSPNERNYCVDLLLQLKISEVFRS